jgi:hypothetical protein
MEYNVGFEVFDISLFFTFTAYWALVGFLESVKPH